MIGNRSGNMPTIQYPVCFRSSNRTPFHSPTRFKKMSSSALFGSVEAGGTKFVCAVGDASGQILAQTTLPTTSPKETLARVIAFFENQPRLRGIGVGSFGPVDLRPDSPTWGYITTTPKPGWRHTDMAGTLSRALNLPIAFDTDVNAAALGEKRWGAAQGVNDFIYLTIGTGIGGGGMINGGLMHGLLHPEMGHIRLPHDSERDPFPGACPYHGDCLEGLASGPAIAQRWGAPGDELPPEHPAWELEAHYLALALTDFILSLSPERIILGGGVMKQRPLFPKIREKVKRLLADYVQHPVILHRLDNFIVPPGLGDTAGVMGALALAMLLDAST